MLIKRLSDAYYAGTPLVSDAVYDALERKYGNDDVGGDAGDVKHLYRLYSLNKVYDPVEVDSSFSIKTPKLDGNAVSLLYVDGELVLGLTRGDGFKGHDITEKLEYLVPNVIDLPGVVQIDGEVVGSSSIENSRNFTAGALNLKDFKEFESRCHEGNIVFALYFVRGADFKYYTDMMKWASSADFLTVLDGENSWSNYPKDGAVYRVNDMQAFFELGFTNKYPRGAIALKERAEGAITTLKDIIWQVGRTGKVTPVAILEPVVLEDAKCSQASLHNPAIMEALGVYIGCTVRVHRAGSIIPQVLEVID